MLNHSWGRVKAVGTGRRRNRTAMRSQLKPQPSHRVALQSCAALRRGLSSELSATNTARSWRKESFSPRGLGRAPGRFVPESKKEEMVPNTAASARDLASASVHFPAQSPVGCVTLVTC